jgi:hypothetical protein
LDEAILPEMKKSQTMTLAFGQKRRDVHQNICVQSPVTSGAWYDFSEE